MNLADVIEGHARTDSASPAVLRDEGPISYGELTAAVRRVASILAAQDVAASDVVGVSIRGNAVLHLVIIIALARLGAILVPVSPGMSRAVRKAVARHFKMTAIVAGRPDDPGAGDARAILANASWLEDRATGKAPPSHPGGEHPWSITHTSGTTGTPKGVLRSHAGFLRLAALLGTLWYFGPGSRLFSFMDLHNGAALKRTLESLSHGGAVYLTDKNPAEGPLIERHGITHVYASPFMMQTWVDARPPRAPLFATLKQVAVGGGPTSPALARDIVERITPNLFIYYGMTETGFVAAGDPRTWAQHPGVTGRLVPWIECEAVDESDRRLPAGESGVLRYRGEGVASGYHGVAPEAGALAKTFRDGWFYPGDLGRITEDRLVYLEGRVDDVVNLGGPKINTTLVESVFARHPSVREAAVFTVVTPQGKPRLVAAVVARGAFSKTALAQYYREQGGRFPGLLRIVQVPTLPRNARGKVLKQELKLAIQFKSRSQV